MPKNPFENQKRDTVGFADIVDRDDVRMVQRGQRFCFASKHVSMRRRQRADSGEELQRDVTVESRIASAKDLSHAAFPDFLEKAKLVENVTGLARHRRSPAAVNNAAESRSRYSVVSRCVCRIEAGATGEIGPST